MSKTELLRCDNISKRYMMGDTEVCALDGVSLSVAGGEYIAVLGPSGSGKSTLMNILGCLDTPTAGEYYLAGKQVNGLTRNELAWMRNVQIGFIFQSFNLLAHATALENVMLPLVYRGACKAERTDKAAAILAKVGLGDRLHHLPNELSGGQRQRVAIARALVTEPNLILADEPTGNLDSKTGAEVMTLFGEMIDGGKTLMMVTHDEQLAKRCQRVITIQDGKIKI